MILKEDKGIDEPNLHAEKGLFVSKTKKDKLDIDKLKNVSRDLK